MGGSAKGFLQKATPFGMMGGWDFLDGPKMPKPPEPEAPVEKGEEGVRRGSMQRQAKRRALGNIYMTRGQNRGTGTGLGGQQQMLG